MKYILQKYPTITNRDKYLANIAGMDEIGIIDKGEYTVVQYNVAFPDTFLSRDAREARGIVFDNATGRVLRRPFHKFFNVNEKSWTQLEDLKKEEVLWVANKLDGTLISPFIVNNKIIWGTKRVADDFHHAVENFLTDGVHTEYEDFVRTMIAADTTPLFEFHDPDVEGTVIVIQYKKAFLRLIGLRDNKTGQYVDLESIKESIQRNFPSVEVVEYFEKSSIEDIQAELETAEGVEGRVVMLRNTGLVKIKSPWYVKRHKVKSLFLFDHIKAQLVLEINPDVSMDDIAPNMQPEDVQEFERFSKELQNNIHKLKDWLLSEASKYSSRKEYGLSDAKHAVFSGLVFPMIGISNPATKAYELAVSSVKKNVNKGIKYTTWVEEVRNL